MPLGAALVLGSGHALESVVRGFGLRSGMAVVREVMRGALAASAGIARWRLRWQVSRRGNVAFGGCRSVGYAAGSVALLSGCSWSKPNPSVKRDWPLVAPSAGSGILQLSGSGHPALRPAPYLQR